MKMERPPIRGRLGADSSPKTMHQAWPGLWYRPRASGGDTPSAPRNAICLQLSAFTAQYGDSIHIPLPESGCRPEGLAPSSFRTGPSPTKGRPDHGDHGDHRDHKRPRRKEIRGPERTDECSSGRATSPRGWSKDRPAFCRPHVCAAHRYPKFDGNPWDFTLRREK